MMAPASRSYEIIQSGGDENVASSGRINEEEHPTKTQPHADAAASLEDEMKALRRDPQWSVRAGARFEATVGERIREVTTLLDELRASQGKLRGEIEEAREAVAWTDAVEGAKETLEQLPEYVRKAQDANRRMKELRKRLERAEARVSALGS
jgi:predicted RNase H-like nuclease (RuvC/YqgF family)